MTLRPSDQKYMLNMDIYVRRSLIRRKIGELFSTQISRNVLFAGGQALVAIAVMFIAYRAFLHEVGIERLGLWSLLLAGTSIARLADMTGGGGLSRFVAQAREDDRDAAIYVHTLTLATLALYSIISLLFFSFARPLLSILVDPRYFAEANELMPLALVAGLILSPIAAILSSAVDGTRRADHRAIIITLSYLVFLGVALSTITKIGIWAWGAALACQQLVMIAGAWIVLRRHISGLGILPYRWSNSVLLETVGYGLKLQANSLAGLLSDPLAKYFLSRYGGLEAVGLYELATRLVLGLRGVIVQMVVPLVPEFARLHNNHKKILDLLRRANKTVIRSAAVYLSGMLLVAPLYSLLMLDQLRMDLILIIGILALGYAINTIAAPYYFAGVGLNILRWNVGSQFLMAACIVTLSIFLGPLFGIAGAIFAVFFGLVCGAIMVVIGNTHALRQVTQPEKQ